MPDRTGYATICSHGLSQVVPQHKKGVNTGVKEVSAGGVVYKWVNDTCSILLIEDRYSRWTLPKGKQESGETFEQTALREIEEETGIRGTIEQPLEVITYHYFHPDHGDVEKQVHYYLVSAKNNQATPQLSEISSVAWLSPEEAWNRQQREGYDNNHQVLLKAFQRLGLRTKAKEGNET